MGDRIKEEDGRKAIDDCARSSLEHKQSLGIKTTMERERKIWRKHAADYERDNGKH
jgi:hypothetical protein